MEFLSKNLIPIVVVLGMILAILITRGITKKNQERSMMHSFSAPKPEGDDIEQDEDDIEQDEDESMSWEKIEEDMDIGKHYATYGNLLNVAELDIILEHGWKLRAVDDEAYYFEKVPDAK